MSDGKARGPLEGKIVLDLTTALAGPFGTLLLASLGARVIKVENASRDGDSSRNNAPYMTSHGVSLQRESPDDMSISMMVRGRNKESITLNLKSDEGRAVFLELAKKADVVFENYSSGVTGRLGIDYEAVRAVNPAIVYTSISGFGSQGVSRDGKAMDTIIQAMSGIMMTAGEPNDPPVRFGLPIADLTPPLYAVIGTLAALLHREHTGEGQHVDVSMLGALTSLVATEPFDALESVGIHLRTGMVVPRLAPFGTFEAKDGWFAICAPTDAFATSLLAVLGQPELIEDMRFATRDARVANADVLHGMIAEWAKDRGRDEVVAALEAGRVPAAPVRDISEAVRDELVVARKEVVPVAHPVYGEMEGIYGNGLPIRFSESAAGFDKPAPYLGQHTDDILHSVLGYSDAQISDLKSSGVV